MRFVSVCAMCVLAVIAFCAVTADDDLVAGPAMRYMPAFMTFLAMSAVRLPRRWLRIASYAMLWLDGSLVMLILSASGGRPGLAGCAMAIASIWFFSDFFSGSLAVRKKS